MSATKGEWDDALIKAREDRISELLAEVEQLQSYIRVLIDKDAAAAEIERLRREMLWRDGEEAVALKAEIERLRATAEKDAVYVGNLEYTLNEIIRVSEDEWVIEVARRALEGK
jgi:hypothetical protein